METYSANEVQNLKNKLSVTTLINNIDSILEKELLDSRLENYLTGLSDKKKLNDLKFFPGSTYIKNLYSEACKKFRNKNEVSVLSYGLAIISNILYLYIKKPYEESLNYISNFDNIRPVKFNKYMNLSKSGATSETMLKAGLNIYGYSYEFNVNYFLQTLSNLIELPNLMIDLASETKFASYKELDIAYFNQDKSFNNNYIGLLKCGAHLKILNKQIHSDNNNYELHENALILGEVKSTFPKILYHKDEVKGKESLETIIDKLFGKLDDFYKLYQKIGLFNATKLNTIQIILFYDNAQIEDIDSNIIMNFIKKSTMSDNYRDIPIHFFIIYTLPAITNIIIYDLKKQITSMKEDNKKREEDNKKREEENKKREDENKKREEENKKREDENKKREEEIKNLQKENKIILQEIANLKKIQNKNTIEENTNNTIFKDNNLIEGDFTNKVEEKKPDDIKENLENRGLFNYNQLEENNIFNFIDNNNNGNKIKDSMNKNSDSNNANKNKIIFNDANEIMDYFFNCSKK